MQLPEAFITLQRGLYGARGEAFVRALPDTLAGAAARWGLTLGQPFKISYNYVTAARLADGTPVVLKAGVPGERELLTEMAALRAWDGVGAARLLRADPAAGLMLLEHVLPGTPLADLLLPESGLAGAGPACDEAATRIAAGVFAQAARPLPAGHDFPAIADLAAGLSRLRPAFGGGTGPFPRRVVEAAESLFTELLASQGPPVLLHGDLHHWNILQAGPRGWLLIDPKGVAGEREYELGCFLRNPMDMLEPLPNLRAVLQRRIAILCEHLGYDRRRVAGWALASTVLAAWWFCEESGAPSYGDLVIAEALDKQTV